MYFESYGEIELYSGKYLRAAGPRDSRYWHNVARKN
jgi:hypothetical protein